MKSTATESGPSKLNFSPARLKRQNCFCTFKHQGCPHLWTSVGLPLLLHMTNQGPQPYHGCLVLLPHTARTFLQGTTLSHRSNPVSSPFKGRFSEPSGASLGSQCYWVGPGHQTLIFTATFTACLTCNRCTAEHEVVPPGQEGDSPTQAGSRKLIKSAAGCAPKELHLAEPNLQPQPLSKAPVPVAIVHRASYGCSLDKNARTRTASVTFTFSVFLLPNIPCTESKGAPQRICHVSFWSICSSAGF